MGDININFRNENLVIRRNGVYSGGRPAITIVTEYGEPFATLTVNLPDEPLEDGEFHVKTWSENKPIADLLRDSIHFEDTGKRVSTGFVEAEIWRLTPIIP